ncbi:MAG: hypothetical protein JO307_08500 [Bryobacterales bacterium]|nr:hypothetical protein [Bryobacterales bacterium]
MKRTSPRQMQGNVALRPNGATIVNVPLRAIVQFSFRINQPPKPNWRYDITARTPQPSRDDDARLLM